MWPPLGTWPATQACALTGNGMGNTLVHSLCSIHWATPAWAKFHICYIVFFILWAKYAKLKLARKKSFYLLNVNEMFENYFEFDGKFSFLSFFLFIIFFGMTLVNTLIQASGAQFHNISSVHCIVCSPPQVKTLITIYPPAPYSPPPSPTVCLKRRNQIS